MCEVEAETKRSERVRPGLTEMVATIDMQGLGTPDTARGSFNVRPLFDLCKSIDFIRFGSETRYSRSNRMPDS